MKTRKYFGTDGVRGTVGKDVIEPAFITRLAHAAGRVLVHSDHSHTPTVILGKDTRISGYMLECALVAGLTSAGVTVLQTGPIPTPGVAYLTRALRLDAGLMISASHNIFSDNGVKFFAAGGLKLSNEIELEIENELEKPMKTVDSQKLGRARRIDGVAERYIEFCKSTFSTEMSLRGLKIVVDCAHGAGYHIAPRVFHELGADVIEIGVSPNGFNINEKVGATYPQTLQAAVLQNEADFGIALDGDGDRLMMVDRFGKVYDGDKAVYIIAKARKATGTLIGGVVGTEMTNMGMENALKERNIAFERSAVGDRYIMERLLQNGWQLGGENSGHVICLDKHTTGDGIISALQVLSSLNKLDTDLPGVMQDWQDFPQSLVNVPVEKGKTWRTPKLEEEVQKVEAQLGDSGRVLLRPSGTEPVVRVMVEARQSESAQKHANHLAQVLHDSL